MADTTTRRRREKIEPERWQRLKTILADALEQDSPEDRTALVERRCAEDAALLQEAESLLAEAEVLLKEPTDRLEECAEKAASTLWQDDASQCGRRIGAYVIISELGHGGMGTVYLAARADGQFEKQVAIKILNRGTDTEELLRRFRAERQILAGLDHPNIARLLDAGTTDDGLPYFIMDYVLGTPVTQFVSEQRLPIAQRLGLFLKICGAVEAAHRKLVVHRDLKPSNIVVTPNGEPKLLDFGIAKLIDQGEQAADHTARRHQRLTPNYASPEQARGEVVTHASDVYALGTLLYELLTGKTPHRFSTSNPAFDEVERVLSEHQPELASQIVGDPGRQRQLRGELDRIMCRALRPDPAERYASVAGLADDIRTYLAHRPLRGLLTTKRRRAVIAALAAAFVVFSGIIVVGKHHSASLLPPSKTSVTLPASVDSIRAVAVLPFDSFGGNRGDDLLGLGMADAIIGRMSGLKKLVVLPTAAVSRFKGDAGDAIAAGRDLHVDAVLCGTVQRSGDRMRVTVQLVNVTTRQTLWASTFDQNFTDIFGVQDSISQQVARSLAINLSPEDQTQLVKRNTSSTAAYDLYLLGLSSYNLRTKEGLATAIDYFKRAIEADLNYALAYALLSDCYCLQGYYKYQPSAEVMPLAKTAAEQALRIDSSLAEAYLALANVQSGPDPTGEKERLLRRAIDLNPNLALAHQRYAWYLVARGNLEGALSEMKRAQQLDPLSSTNNTAVGLVYIFAHQFEPGLRYSEKAAELNPNEPFIQSNLGSAYILNHRYPEAISRFQRAIELDPGMKGDDTAAIALTLWSAGKIPEANRTFEETLSLAADGKVDPYQMALVYAARGDKDEAFKWFAQSLEKGGPASGFIRYDPLLDPLRSDSRFTELLRRFHRAELEAFTSK